MTEIIRNRTIRPTTRLEESKSYKIDTKAVSRGDILILTTRRNHFASLTSLMAQTLHIKTVLVLA